MIVGASAISASAISALPLSEYASGSADVRFAVLFEAQPTDPYIAFIRSTSHLVWAIEVTHHPVPDNL